MFGVPLRRVLHVVVCDSTILAGFSDTARVRQFAREGRLVSELRFPIRERTVSAAERERLARARIERSTPDFRPRVAAALGSGDIIPPTRPAFDALAGDATGTLWVALSADDPDARSSWLRLAPNGSILDTVHLAPRARVVSASGDRLVTLSHDVERVVVSRTPPIPARPHAAAAPAAAAVSGCYRGVYSAVDR